MQWEGPWVEHAKEEKSEDEEHWSVILKRIRNCRAVTQFRIQRHRLSFLPTIFILVLFLLLYSSASPSYHVLQHHFSFFPHVLTMAVLNAQHHPLLLVYYLNCLICTHARTHTHTHTHTYTHTQKNTFLSCNLLFLNYPDNEGRNIIRNVSNCDTYLSTEQHIPQDLNSQIAISF